VGEFVFGGTLLRALALGLAAFALLWVVTCVLVWWARREAEEE
jgi:uncharacterized membrane protein (DUF485 family)